MYAQSIIHKAGLLTIFWSGTAELPQALLLYLHSQRLEGWKSTFEYECYQLSWNSALLRFVKIT